MNMEDVLRYLIENSTFESNLRGSRNELFLVFDDIEISIFFCHLNEDVYNENYLSVDELDISLLCENPIEKIIIQEGSFIHNDDAKRNEYVECYKPYSSIGYELIRAIKDQFPNSINGFRVGSYCSDDSCSMCDDVYEYGFQIDVNEKYWACKDFYKYIIDKNSSLTQVARIPSFYNLEYEVKDSYDLKYISTNTKTRRIGYLKILLSMFVNQPQIPELKLNTRFELLCQKYEQYRLLHKNTKGNVILTKNGTSAKPYVELALKFGLLNKGGNIYRLGKIGKAYEAIASHFGLWEGNPFVLNRIDTLFWSELILREDYWFTYNILEQAVTNPTISYNILKKTFKGILLKQVDEYIDDLCTSNSSTLMRLGAIKRQIAQWEKPEVYLEHILMPRLNWLYDMDYILLNSDLSYSLTQNGKRLLYNLALWNDIALHKVCSPAMWLDMYYLKMMNIVYELSFGLYCDLSITNYIQEYLEKDFNKFRTLAPNRITYSIFASFLKYTLFEENNIVMDNSDIRKMFESNRLSSYILKYQPQYKDGYIQKIK